MRPVPLSLCLPLIHQFEGLAGQFRPVPAQDPAGNWEIGWGHRLAGPTYPGAPLDAAGAEALARADLSAAGLDVCNALGASVLALADSQYAALVDFTYNEGEGNFASSTLCKLIRADQYAAAADEFPRWVYIHQNGQAVVAPGLVRRRAAEQSLWNTHASAR